MTLTYFLGKQGSWNVPKNPTPLHLAAYFNIPWLVQIYIAGNRNSVHATTPMNDTPLIWASEMGSTECVQRLLGAGADPNEFEIDGWSALHWAARNGHLRVATLLLEHDAPLYHPDRGGHTPLDWAFDREHWDVVNLFEEWIAKNDPGRMAKYSKQQHLIRGIMNNRASRKTGQLWDFRP
jgi:ankyrin repeat protein